MYKKTNEFDTFTRYSIFIVKGSNTMEWKNEKEKLESLILNEKLSYEEIGRRYNVSGASIKKAAKRLGIELEKRREINPKEHFNKTEKKTHKCINCGKEFEHSYSTFNKFCSTQCQKEFRHKETYRKIVEGDESIMRGNYSPKYIKDFILNEQNGLCAICGCKQEHNGKPLTFIIDHIDGNAANNKRDNLRCICPNCDSQLDTYKSKNKNGARSYYRYHKFDNNS